jgi:hypothetical protein
VLLTALALGLGLAACKKKEPPPAAPPPTAEAPAPGASVRVTEVQLGNALGPDKRVQAPSESFSTKDTIFASVVTEGSAPAAEITARWTFQDGQVVNETKRSIGPSPKEVTEFSIQKPDGFPAGEYTVAILLDGKPVESKKFRVQ